jgi:hypothetical protein
LTVLAYDGRYLVADGRATRGTRLVGDNVKKLEIVNVKGLGKCAVGVCGVLLMKGPFLEHLKEKGLKEQMESHIGGDAEGPYELQGLVLSKKGCFEFSSDGGWFEVDTPTALGSGGAIASHFLTTGSDALTAVRETIKTDVSCGGTITIYDLETGKLEVITGE